MQVRSPTIPVRGAGVVAMIKRGLLGSSILDSPSLLDDADRDSMDSMSNLMDVMLVFVCGLLIALIVHWNIDLSSVESPSSPSMQELEGDMQEVPDGIDIEGGDYSQLGTVYRDEATGQLYVVTD